jgi:hypothetical protein
MKTYVVILHIDIDEESNEHPAKWQYDELIGEGVRDVTVYDVTDESVERLRIDADGVEEVA